MEPRLSKVAEWLIVGAVLRKPGRSLRRLAGRGTPPGAARLSHLAEAVLCPAGDAPLSGPRRRRARSPARQLARWLVSRRRTSAWHSPAMQRLAMDLRMLSRELSLYLEHQVRIGFFGSGVGLSLILGFSVAYACYYLSSIAKVSRGVARAPRRRAKGGFPGSDSVGHSPRLVAGRNERRGLSWGRACCSLV